MFTRNFKQADFFFGKETPKIMARTKRTLGRITDFVSDADTPDTPADTERDTARDKRIAERDKR